MSYKYLLLDLPTDHEVDGFLPTECDVVRAILTNRKMGQDVRHVRAMTKSSLVDRLPTKTCDDIRFVHVAGHGNRKGVGLMGDVVPWRELAEVLKGFCTPLAKVCSQRSPGSI